jgi:hypothetical protein
MRFSFLIYSNSHPLHVSNILTIRHQAVLTVYTTYDIYHAATLTIIIILLQLGWHPVTVVQYIFTHKQYKEYRERNIHNNKKKQKIGKCGPCPVFASYTPGICLTTEEKAWENLS